eukprot:2750303-Prymnesium_polylepis.1
MCCAVSCADSQRTAGVVLCMPGHDRLDSQGGLKCVPLSPPPFMRPFTWAQGGGTGLTACKALYCEPVRRLTGPWAGQLTHPRDRPN